MSNKNLDGFKESLLKVIDCIPIDELTEENMNKRAEASPEFASGLAFGAAILALSVLLGIEAGEEKVELE